MKPASWAREAQEEEGDTQERETGEEILTAPDQEERREEVRDAQTNERRALLHTAGGGDDARATRAQLSEFEERVRLMRNAISSGNGWFEWYYVKRPKRRTPTQEALAYLGVASASPTSLQNSKPCQAQR